MLRNNPFIEPCQPTIQKEPPTGPQWLHEVKFDGYRIQIHKAGKDVSLFSKNGNDFTNRFPDITYAIAALPTTSFILDAELTACSHDGSPTSPHSSARKTATCACGYSTSWRSTVRTCGRCGLRRVARGSTA